MPTYEEGGEGNLIFFYTCLPSKKQSIECKCFQLTFASSCFRLSDVIYEQLKRQLSKQFAKPCNVECMTLYFLLKHIHTSVSLAFTVGWYYFNPIHINVTKFVSSNVIMQRNALLINMSISSNKVTIRKKNCTKSTQISFRIENSK